MIINHEKRFIFIHVPKTGGNSVKAVIPGEIQKGSTHRKLSSTRLTPGCDNYFSFGFVRNPWDRMCSLYHYFTQKQNKNVEGLSFKEVLLGQRFESGYRDAMYYLEGVTFIGRFEQFQKDLDIVCERIGLGHTQLPRLNASDHGHYRNYYDDDMIDFVAKHHKKTIDQLGYEF